MSGSTSFQSVGKRTHAIFALPVSPASSDRRGQKNKKIHKQVILPTPSVSQSLTCSNWAELKSEAISRTTAK